MYLRSSLGVLLMKLFLLPHPLLHLPLLLHQAALHCDDGLQTLAHRLARAVLECGRVAAEGELGVDAVPSALLEEEEPLVQLEPLLEVEARHVAGEVGLGLEGGAVGGEFGNCGCHCGCAWWWCLGSVICGCGCCGWRRMSVCGGNFLVGRVGLSEVKGHD